jgi:hypothetical protein
MYATYQTSGTRRPSHRTWLAVGLGLVAVLVVLFLAVAACTARGNDSQAGAIATPTATGDAATGVGAGGENSGGENAGDGEDSGDGNPGGGDGDGGGDAGDGGEGENPGEGDDGGEDTGGDDGDGGEEPAEPSIEVTVFGPPPTATCQATGKIAIVGGDSQVLVTYRWYRLDLPPHLNPALPNAPLPVMMEEKTLPIPPASEITVKSPKFPTDDSTNVVWLAVTIPDQTVSQQVAYGKCAELGFGFEKP